MARIRTIKPEFPQSESLGRCSRDARLLFVNLWTLCDDSGRTRGASRMLASLLFPYDDDAPSLMDGWIAELVREGCIIHYVNDGTHYVQICKWLNHQKIDHPSESKIPPFANDSGILARTSETFALEGKGREGKGEDRKSTNPNGLESAGENQKAPPADACPHSEIIAEYHSILPELARVRTWDTGRQKLLRTRWRESEERQTVGWWSEYFRYVKSCPFLVGQVASRDREPFVADLEWLIKPSNFRKVIEGKYEAKRGAA